MFSIFLMPLKIQWGHWEILLEDPIYSQKLENRICHDMMTSSNENIFCVTGPLWGESTGHSQRPVKQSFTVFFDLGLNKRLSKHSQCWWFETSSHSLWCHCKELLLCLSKIHLRHSEQILIFGQKTFSKTTWRFITSSTWKWTPLQHIIWCHLFISETQGTFQTFLIAFSHLLSCKLLHGMNGWEMGSFKYSPVDERG